MLVVALTIGGVGVASAGKATAATTPLGTITKTGTDLTNGSTATAGGSPGTANPGDTLKWVLNYSNTQSSPVTANITDPITGDQSYVPGSLQVPPGMTGQWSTNGGSSYTTTQPASGVNAVGATGTVVPGTTGASSPFGSPSSSFTTSTTGGDGWQAMTYTGDVTLHKVTIADQFVAPAGPAVTVTCPGTTLAPGASMTCTSSPYTVTQADVDAGSVANMAIAHGTTPEGKDLQSNDSRVRTATGATSEVGFASWSGGVTDSLLAFTGSNVIPMIVTGLLAILMGVFLTVVSRRRREHLH